MACDVCELNKIALRNECSPLLNQTSKHSVCKKRTSAGCTFSTPVSMSGEQVQVSSPAAQTIQDSSQENSKDVPIDPLQKISDELPIESIEIPEKTRILLRRIVAKDLAAFAKNDNDLGCTKEVEHTINTGDRPPFRENQRGLPFSRKGFVERQLERYLQAGVISHARQGDCPYASAIVVVKKKEVDPAKQDDAFRLCIDYRRLNSETVKDAHPLPRIDDIIVNLHDDKFFASLDLLIGYHQIPVAAADKTKTAFVTHKGLFVFNRMPFGLTNAPATFQRLMDRLFGEFIGKDTLVYLDDLLMFAETREGLLHALHRNLRILIEAGLKCKPRKCKLFRESILYLGFVITPKGVAPGQDKIAKIQKWPFPETGIQMLGFLGLVGYYRKLFPNLANYIDALYSVAQQSKIEKTPELEKEFEHLKALACKIPTLRIPNPSKPFIMETDASTVAVGAVLIQADENGVERPVQWYSQGLGKSERNYSTYERELFAVVKGSEAFRVFLL